MQLSPELKKRLLKVLDAFSEGYEQHNRNQVEQNAILGLGAMALAIPVVAIKGLTPALSLMKFALPKLFQAHQNEQEAQAVRDLREKFLPRPSFSSKRPRPY